MSAGTRRGSLYFVTSLGALAVVVAVASLTASHGAATRAETARRASAAKVGVDAIVVTARRAPSGRRIEVQGEARPYAAVTLYAKVSGYLKEIRVDRGDKVSKGQVLAVIDSPELQSQYDAAKADATMKRANATRAAHLAEPGVVSVREAEMDRAQAAVADATVATLATQRDYTTLRAPFAGTVTARYADPGALVQNAGAAQTGALPVVTVGQHDRLRVFAYVDQRDAATVRTGDPADVLLPEQGVAIHGHITRTSAELDPRTRTLLVEIDIANKDRAIVPGSFVTVVLTAQSAALIEIPVAALVIRAAKPFVVVVGPDDRVSFRPVTVAHHDGIRVSLSAGLSDGERVALNLGRNVVQGDLVRPVAPKPGDATPAK